MMQINCLVQIYHGEFSGLHNLHLVLEHTFLQSHLIYVETSSLCIMLQMKPIITILLSSFHQVPITAGLAEAV